MPEDVFDLGGEIEGEAGVGVAHPAQDTKDMGGAVQEVRVPEGDVPGSHAHLLVHVGEHHVGGHGEEPAVVNRRDRAVQAGMQAAARGLGVTGRKQFDAVVQLGVPLQSGQRVAVRDQPVLTGEIRGGSRTAGRRGISDRRGTSARCGPPGRR